MLILRGSNKTMELRDSLRTFLLPRLSAWSCLKMRDRWCIIQFSSVQSLSHIWLFDTPRLQHARLPCPSPTPGARSNSCPSCRWCHPTVSSSVVPFSSCLQSFPTSGSFLISRLLIILPWYIFPVSPCPSCSSASFFNLIYSLPNASASASPADGLTSPAQVDDKD